MENIRLKFKQRIAEFDKDIKKLELSNNNKGIAICKYGKHQWEDALNLLSGESVKRTLIDFANFLNKYEGLEKIRFDFMVQDYLESINSE